jgi:hypothetical protein
MTGGFAARISVSGEAACGFAAECLCRSGLVCLATCSHSARSSSLRLRLRRGGPDDSGSGIDGGRFTDGTNHGGLDDDTARDPA